VGTAAPGTRARVVARKWGDRPHWEHAAVLLGSDEHGTWLGTPPGTARSRPGAAYVTDGAQVTLVPPDSAFVATFFTRGGSVPCEVYVDISTVPVWSTQPDGVTVTAVDLDLDVVRGWSGRVWVDDEDEFADHRVRLGSPADVVRLATSTCEAVRSALEDRRAPYDGQARAWLARLDDLTVETR
jgi:hypothetical protein